MQPLGLKSKASQAWYVHVHSFIVCTFADFSIGLFYYLLGNLSPYLRSQLRSIKLLAVAKATVIVKYGINVILESFMKDLKELERVMLIIQVTYTLFILHSFRMESQLTVMVKSMS